MDTNGRRSSVSMARPSIDGDWRVRESVAPRAVPDSAFKSALYAGSSEATGAGTAAHRVSFADDRRNNANNSSKRLPRSGSSQGDSSEEEGSSGSASEQQSNASQHAAMNAKRMSMDPAPYDFNDPMFSTDEFRVWEMKIRNCPKSRPHDWTCCPFAHPGEKAKRRDPRLFSYCGTACADYRKFGSCTRGDSCMYAHGVFECWLHPSRYRTQLCTDGEACSRRVCFFAHRECELRKPVGGQMAAIPQPGVSVLETLGIMSGNGGGNVNGSGHANGGMMSHAEMHAEMHAEAQRRASMGAMPPANASAPLPTQPGVSQGSYSASLSAAIQMLDPVSKHRLLEALQNDLHETASQSAFFGGAGQDHVPKSVAQMAHSQSLLEAIQQLQLGARMSRHSLDDITPILSGHGGVGGVGGRHASGLPQYNPSQSQAHQYLSSITSSRKSVDIGAVSRLATGSNGLVPGFSADFHSRQVPSMDGGSRSMSNRNSIDLGTLYESSGSMNPAMNPAMNSAQAAALMQAFPNGNGNVSASRRMSVGEDPRMILSKIVENPNTESNSNTDSEGGSGSGGSSSVATVVRSSSEGSSMASQLASGVATANATPKKKFQREFSVDNLLAELPRSASQVDLVNNNL